MLPRWAEQYVGLPYRPLGRDREGCDCWGLLALVLREQFGYELPDYSALRWQEGVNPRAVGEGAQEYASRFTPVALGQERAGDGVLLRLRGHPLHVGVVVAPTWMLHTHEAANSCVENYTRPLWKHRVIGIYRYNHA